MLPTSKLVTGKSPGIFGMSCMENMKLPKCVMFGELIGFPGCVETHEKKWMGLSSEQSQSFRYQRRPDERERHVMVKQRTKRLIANWIAAENARAALRHAVVCPNVAGRAKERRVQSKSARTDLIVIVDYMLRTAQYQIKERLREQARQSPKTLPMAYLTSFRRDLATRREPLLFLDRHYLHSSYLTVSKCRQ